MDRNNITTNEGPASLISGEGARHVRLSGNTLWCAKGSAMRLEKVSFGAITANMASNCGGAGLELSGYRGFVVSDNVFFGNETGIVIENSQEDAGQQIHDSVLEVIENASP